MPVLVSWASDHPRTVNPALVRQNFGHTSRGARGGQDSLECCADPTMVCALFCAGCCFFNKCVVTLVRIIMAECRACSAG